MEKDAKQIEHELLESINKKEAITSANIKKAQEIGFKNTTEQLINTDQFGFFVDK